MIVLLEGERLEIVPAVAGDLRLYAAGVDYVTVSSDLYRYRPAAITAAGAATWAAAPSAGTARELRHLVAVNRSTAPVAVDVQITDGSTTTVLGTWVIAAGALLEYSAASGWTAPSLGSGGLSGLRNRLINGAQEIDQANVGASVACGVGQNWITDQWAVSCNQAGKLTAQRSAVAPAGFINSLCVTVASAYTPAAIDAFDLRQPIEGVNLVDLAWGTASAQPVAVSFWVRGSVPGTYAVSFRNAAVTRSYVALITIAAANTWERKTVTLPGCTDGVWATDNGVGLYLCWDLGHGSDYQASAGSWLTGNYVRTSTCVSFVSQVAGSTLYLTGAQLEVGSAASAFERRMHELFLCQRYYEKSFRQSAAPAQGAGTLDAFFFLQAVAAAGAQTSGFVPFKAPKRNNATVTIYNPSAANAQARNYTTGTDCSSTAIWSATQESGFVASLITAAGSAVGNPIGFHWTASDRL